MHRYQICVALDERFGPNDVSLDVRTDQQHPLLKHEMQIVTSTHGRAVLILTFTAVDLWTAILTGMALVRQSGYVPVAVQARATTRRSVRSGWHKRRTSTTDSPVSLMTCAGYREKRRRLLDLLDAQDLDCSSAAPSGQFVVVFRWRPLPHCGHSGGCNGEQKSQLPDRLLRRVRHVVTESRRVLDAVSSLRQNDLSRFSRALTESHASLRDDSQVSVPELDTLVGIAQETPGVSAPADRRRLRKLRRGRGHSRRSRGCQGPRSPDATVGEVTVRDCVRRRRRRSTEGPVAVRRQTRADSDT